MKDEFGRFHPIVNITFYVVILGITMFQNNPFFIGISFIAATVYLMIMEGKEMLRKLVGIFALFVCSSIVNPLFSHRGVTLLFYLPTGNPVTMESILFGLSAAGMISSIVMWCFSLRKILTSDKIMAVVGKVFPTIALIFSMVLKFVPGFSKHAKETSQVNQILYNANENKDGKLKRSMNTFSITSTWALENSIDTADAMIAKGYGTGKRTNYNNYKITVRDVAAMIAMCILFVCIFLLKKIYDIKNYYYPIVYVEKNKIAILVYIMFATLCMMPVIINLVEEIRWHKLKSKI